MNRCLFLTLVLAACGPASPTPQHAETDAPSGNPAVRERLRALPAPPRAWSTPVRELTPDDFALICEYLSSTVGLESSVVSCPDGSTTEQFVYDCDPTSSAEHARGLPDEVSLGEMVACYVAMREHPCEGERGSTGLPECQCYEQCVLPLEHGASE